MKVNSRFLYGILSILLAAIIAFIAIPTVTRKTNSKVEIIRITTALDRGDPITAKDVELAEVGGFNLPDRDWKLHRFQSHLPVWLPRYPAG